MKKLTSLLALAFLTVIVLGSFQVVSAAPFRVMGSDADSYLADSRGMTLYIFLKDDKGQATCVGACVEKWPIRYSAPFAMIPIAKILGLVNRLRTMH